MKDYQFHELCVLFPPCGEEELESLRADIEKNGVIEKVTMYEGKVLDGRNRVLACMMLGIEPPTVEFNGDDPVMFVMAKNLHRRHLTDSQRAMIAAKVADMPPYRPENKSANLRTSQEKAAKQVGVSPRSVSTAKKLLKEADEETIKEIEAGKKTVAKAAKELKEKSITTLKVDPFNSPGPTPTPTRPAIYEEPEEEPEPIADPILRANEKAVSIIASIHMLGRQISDYCDIAPEKCIEETMKRFIQACLGLFDNADVERVIKNMKRGAA